MACPNTVVGPAGPAEVASTALTGTLKVEINWYALLNNSIGAPTDRARKRVRYTWGSGSGLNQIQELYRDQRTITLAAWYEDLDLAGVLTNIFNQTITFVKVREFLIYNRATTAGEDLLIGGAGVTGHAWSAPFNGDPYGVYKVRASGVKCWAAPVDGFPLVAGSSDVLRVMHAGTGSSITYDIILKGTIE